MSHSGSSKKKILIANGVNLDLLGTRQPDVYGGQSLKDLEQFLCQNSDRLRKSFPVDFSLEFFQSNDEAVFLTKIGEPWDGAVINPAAWTHTSLALGDRLAATKLPFMAKEKLFLTFPMSKDKEVLRVHWEKASIEIAKRLMEGRSVGFITQGDPMIYSTFLYLMEILKETFPPLETEIVPAVTSISAVPAATQVPLCDGKEKVAVLPATYGVEELRAILQDFDSVVLMKVSSVMDQVIEALTQEDLLGHAVYVERATTHEERVVWDLTTLKGDRCVYFSMVVVNKKIRSGQLLDTRRMGAVVKEKMELEEQVLQ